MPIMTPPPAPGHHPAKRLAMLVVGGLLIVASPVIGALPGPGGIFVFAGGLILVLRASRWARLRWARLKRRFPKLGHLADRVMRRRSALRRHARDKQARDAAGQARETAAQAPDAAVQARDAGQANAPPPATLTSPEPSDTRADTRPSSLAAFSISTIKE